MIEHDNNVDRPLASEYDPRVDDVRIEPKHITHAS
jgi:hypothetical protein